MENFDAFFGFNGKSPQARQRLGEHEISFRVLCAERTAFA
jgi:hypothetical protein